MGKIVTLGEIMLRLSPAGYDRFSQAKEFNAFYGGSEANVSVSLANFGKETSYVTKLPQNAIAQCAVNELRKYGVDTKDIVRGGERIGLYFCENGESQRPAKLVYDRKNSAMALASREDFDWNKIFEGAEWFHFSGITPALSEECAEITLDAVKAAKEKGLTVSIDLNYRENLWENDEDYSKAIIEILQYCDITIGSVEEVELALGEGSGETPEELLKKLVEKFGLKYATIILRNRFTAEDVDWQGILYDGKQIYKSKKYDVHVVDNIGGGDAFAAALIYSITSNKFSNQEIIEFTSIGSCLKYSMNGDVNLSTVDEVLNAMKDATGKVSR